MTRLLRSLALSDRTIVITGAMLAGAHVAWGVWLEPTKRGEILTGFGACLIVLGLLVAARPYLATGLDALVDKEASAAPAPVLSGGRTDAPNLLAKRAEARDNILAERVTAVLVIGTGTLLNGYGPPLIRLLGLEAPS